VTTPILAVRDLSAGYGDAPVIRGLGITVEPGEVAVIIGPNGHGKTTFLRAVSGLLKPSRGEVLLDGEPVAGRTPEYISGLGLVHIPQGDGLFAEMTVEENLLMGAFPGSAWRSRGRSISGARAWDCGAGASRGIDFADGRGIGLAMPASGCGVRGRARCGDASRAFIGCPLGRAAALAHALGGAANFEFALRLHVLVDALDRR